MNLGRTSVVAVSLAALSAATAGAETFTATTHMIPTHWMTTQAMEPLIACIKEGTSDAVAFDLFPSGQLASAAGALEAVQGGLAQMGFYGTSVMSDKLPLNQITMLPDMGGSSAEILAAYRKVLAEDSKMAAELKAAHIVPLLINFVPPYQIGLKGEKIDSLDDFQGKKIRVAGGGQTFSIQALGGVPVQIQAGDAYVAMQQGTIDGYSFSISSVTAYKLQELTGSISTNGNFANAQSIAAVDDRWFAEQTPEAQKVMIDCGAKVEVELAAYLDNLNAQLIKDFTAAGVDMYEFSPELWTEISKLMEPVAADYIKRMAELGLPGQEAYDEYRRALGK